MLRRHKELWSGRLGNVNIWQQGIDLIPGARHFKYVPYRVGQKVEKSNSLKSISNAKPELSNAMSANVLLPSSPQRRKMYIYDYVLNTVNEKR